MSTRTLPPVLPMSDVRPGAPGPVLGIVVLLIAMAAQACSTENVTEVVVVSVTILPTNAAVVEGGTLAFDAVVSEEGGITVDGAKVLWSSDNPDVVVVDDAGMARAVSNGVARIEASFRDVKGSATVTVLPGPTLVLDPAAVSIFGSKGGERPAPAPVRVTNGGLGELRGLTSEIEYATDGPEEWLSIDLASEATPATLTLLADTEDLAAGIYDASILVDTEEPGVDAVRLPVRLTVAGLTIGETRGGTTVREGGATDTFTVALDLEPEEDVLLSLTSEDADQLTVSPSRLRFTDRDWDTPRSVVVAGTDNEMVDGDRTVRVRISVDDGADPAYAAVEDRFLEVTVLDDDVAGLLVEETGVGTVAREGGPADTITVVLTAGPMSDVVVSVWTDDETDATVAPDRLTFTPLDWDVPRVVLFTAVDDDVPDGIGFRTITVEVDPARSDEAFHGLSETVDAITFDNDLYRSASTDPGG